MRRSHNRKNRIRTVFFILAAIFTGFFVVMTVQQFSRARNALVSITQPARSAAMRLGRYGNRVLVYFETQRELRKALRRLEDESRSLRERASRLGELEAENAALRAALGDTAAPHFQKRIVARLLGKTVFAGREALIDRGSTDGVQTGDAVLAGEQTLLGVVYEALPSYARVRLATHGGFRASAITAETRVEGLTRGDAGGKIIFELAPQNAPLKEGDIVITSGLDLAFAPGLVIGTISKVFSEPTSLFSKAGVLPAGDLGCCEMVTVIRGPLAAEEE